MESGCHQRSKAETAMSRYKQLINAKLSLRGYNGQVAEALAGVKVMNKMLTLAAAFLNPFVDLRLGQSLECSCHTKSQRPLLITST